MKKKKKTVKKPLKKKPDKRPAKKPVRRPRHKKARAVRALTASSTHPPKTCNLTFDKDHPYSPVNWSIIDGCYKCPKCNKTFQ